MPPITYSIAAVNRPAAIVPEEFNVVQSFWDSSNDCAVDKPIDKAWCIEGTENAKVVDWRLNITGDRCGSRVNYTELKGQCVYVDAQLRGCGRDCFLGTCNCKGRGILGYNLTILAKDYVWKNLPESTQSRTRSPFVFEYPHPVPVDRKDLRCAGWYVRAAVTEGGIEKVYEMNDQNPSQGGFIAAVAPDTCKITVTEPPMGPVKLRVSTALSDR